MKIVNEMVMDCRNEDTTAVDASINAANDAIDADADAPDK